MCDPEFYSTLHKEMKDKTNMHVCFLGDYFDQGQGVINSIIGISFLKSVFGERVHIILGNRDINKFRIYFESDIDFSDVGIKEKMKKIGYSDNVDGGIKETPEDMMKWMAATMGVVDYDKENCTNQKRHHANCRNGLNIDPRIDEVEAHKLLLAAFDPINFVNGNRAEITIEDFKKFAEGEYKDKISKIKELFKRAISILYCQGNIVELIDDKKILLSHSGGHTPYIHKKLPDLTIQGDYFTKYSEYKDNFPPENGSSEDIETSDIEESVDYHRDIYSDFIKYFQSMSSKDTYKEALEKHIQLQCMGMPNVDIGFITPCDKKPGPTTQFDPKKVPYGDEVKYVAHGHTNFGLPFPIIYKYKYDPTGTTYIACDTSVGNRPKEKPFKMNYLSFGENEEVTMGYKEYVVNGNQGDIQEAITYVPPVIDHLKIIKDVVTFDETDRKIKLVQGVKQGGKSRRKRKSKRRSNKTKRSKKRNTKKRKTIKRRRKSRRNKKK
jgi:hypothetical protein